MTQDRIHLAEVLDFRPDLGVIRLHEQRVVILSAAAMGLLRKELIETLGLDSARRLLLRFGYADGYHDAVNLRARSSWATVLDGVRAGLVLHTLEGIVRAELKTLRFDEPTGTFEAEALWWQSYEAEQHVHHFGQSADPVCWSLVGYVSGYVAACVGQEVYFVENACHGQGEPRCTIEGRDASSWGDRVGALRFDFRGADLAQQVEQIRDTARRQLAALTRRERALARREREFNVLRERAMDHARSRSVVAESPGMVQVLELAAQVAPLDTTVLVYGESGTGKEFVVRLVHDMSPRADGPFVSVNCAALTETLLESELFGHVRGAFTGATRDKPGLFEVADGGTLFLDEIGEAAPSVQAKLLRAIQEREVRRVGGERVTRVNTRVVAATNRDLRAAVDAGTFREDLFFRLGAFVITIPPLRKRREDIPTLVQEFIKRAAERFGKDVTSISADAMTVLIGYDWPGNVRELEHCIERAVIVARGARIGLRELPPEVLRARDAAPPEDTLDLRVHERMLIRRALDRYQGNRRLAARALNISTVTLWRKIRDLELEADVGGDEPPVARRRTPRKESS